MVKAKKKYPDVESVLEVIRTREEIGLPLSPGQLNKGKYPDPDLHKAGIRHCGTWQKAVEAAGFDYANMLGKAKSRYPTAASVIREIKDRHKNGLPLSATDVGRNPGPHRNIALYKAALKHFDEWKSAIEVAGLDYSSIQPRRKRKYPDTDSVVGEIQCRHKAGIPLNGLAVVEGEHRDYMLHKYAQDYFGTWSAALLAAGLDPKKIRTRKYTRRYPDAASVVAEIHRRANSDLPLNSMAVARGGQSDPKLYISGRDYFGTWPAALEAAGLDARTVQEAGFRKYQDAPSIVAEIRRRHEADLPLNVNSIVKPPAPYRETALYNTARKQFGNWKAAIEAAGLDYDDIRIATWGKYPDDDSVVAEIRRRHEAGLPLNATRIAKPPAPHRDATLYDVASKRFGCWSAALEAAGIDPASVRQRKGHPPKGE